MGAERTASQAIGRLFAALIALLAGGAVLIEIALVIAAVSAHGRSWLDGIVTALGFFTVLTNAIVAVIAGACAIRGEAGTLLTRPATRAAVMVYILVVGVIFAVLLAGLRPLAGVHLVVDDVMHRVVPVLFVLYWLFFVPKGTLRWREPLFWLIYPALYVAYSLFYGAATGRYMYPFADVNALGYPRALMNAAVILAFFLALGLATVFLDRRLARRAGQDPAPEPRTGLE